MFDANTHISIAMEIAKHIDNGEGKPKLSDSIRKGLQRFTLKQDINDNCPDEQVEVLPNRSTAGA